MKFHRLIWVSGVLMTALASVHSSLIENSDVQRLIDQVPDGASWQDLSPQLRAGFEANAAATLAADRRAWGLSGLNEKLGQRARPTAAMRQNIDRVLSDEFKSELPDGFVLDRDVKHADLKRALHRIYLDITADRAERLHTDEDSKGWDGKPIKEFQLLDHEHYKTRRLWSEETQQIFRSIDESRLTPAERAILRKGQYRLRRHRFDRPHVAEVAAPDFASFYKLPPGTRPFATDSDLLNAYNASMFSDVRSVDRGSLQSFVWNHETEFDETYLREQGMSEKLVKSILTLGNLYKTRMLAHADRDKRCTLYSAADRAKTWDAFTAGQISNADGSESMEGYAKRYQILAQHRAQATRELAKRTLDALFPPDSPELDAEARAAVKRALDAERRPAAIVETMRAELNKATGSGLAAGKLNAAMERQVTLGGYDSGGPPRKEDEQQILEMWQRIRSYLRREYGGYAVDIAASMPDRPIISTTSDPFSSFATSSGVSIGVGRRENKGILYAIMLHEIKHAIDFRSDAVVEGAAWEGAGVAVMRVVWPRFIEAEMSGDAVGLALARLTIDTFNVLFTATTDAALQIFFRQSCDASEPDTVDFAKGIVAGYGYDDEDFLLLRSKRAHNGSQYLEYDYGLTMYTDLMEYLQAGVGPAPRIDPFLLQACGMPSPKKDEGSVKRLKACIAARRN